MNLMFNFQVYEIDILSKMDYHLKGKDLRIGCPRYEEEYNLGEINILFEMDYHWKGKILGGR